MFEEKHVSKWQTEWWQYLSVLWSRNQGLGPRDHLSSVGKSLNLGLETFCGKVLSWSWRKGLGLDISRPRPRDLNRDHREIFSDCPQYSIYECANSYASDNWFQFSFCHGVFFEIESDNTATLFVFSLMQDLFNSTDWWRKSYAYRLCPLRSSAYLVIRGVSCTPIVLD